MEPREGEIYRNVVLEIERIENNKMFFLFKEMLEAAENPSSKKPGVLHIPCLSADGRLPGDEGVPTAVRDAKLAMDDRRRAKDVIRREVLAACCASDDHDLDLKLAEVTREKVRKGPLPAHDLSELGVWVPGQRFAVVQEGKTRQIDDMSLSRVNDASCSETIDPSDVDHIAAVMRLRADAHLIDESVQHSTSSFFVISRCRDRTRRRLETRLWDRPGCGT